MSLSSTSEILNKLGDPVTSEQFYELMKQFCEEEKNIIETLVETKKYINYFGSYLEEQEFKIRIFKIIKLSFEICENSNDLADILMKTSIINLMETYINYSALSGAAKEAVLKILGETFSSGKFSPPVQIIQVCIMVAPIFNDKVYIRDKGQYEEEIIYEVESVDIELKIKNQMDSWIKSLDINLENQNKFTSDAKLKLKEICDELNFKYSQESYRTLENACVEMLMMQITVASLLLDFGDEDLSPVPLSM